jgi:peptidoglycan hydrolase-like protein with peptidoglycan-binding domain
MSWGLPGRGGSSTVFNHTIKRGMSGIPVWAVQRALNDIGRSKVLLLDGDYGPGTEEAVRQFQSKTGGLSPDGVAGPLTQRKVVGILADMREATFDGPDGIIRSVCQYEGGWLVAPLNWSTAGGVDCGAVQRRVVSGDFGNDAVIERAFNTKYQLNLLANSLKELHDTFIARVGVKGNHELAYRLAILNHNYPYAAQQISKVGVAGLSSYWRTPQPWVLNAGVKFPDGAAVRTPLEWCEHYALSSRQHNDPGQAVALVTSWV